jgi:hypothetical protein
MPRKQGLADKAHTTKVSPTPLAGSRRRMAQIERNDIHWTALTAEPCGGRLVSRFHATARRDLPLAHASIYIPLSAPDATHSDGRKAGFQAISQR